MRPTLTWAVAGLVLDRRCPGCGTADQLLCASCAAALAGPARPRWPRPAPPGLPRPWSVAEYAGVARSALLAHKEQRRLALARPLGGALAASVLGGLDSMADSGRLVRLVPVPSRPAVVRTRGHDPMLRVARAAAAALRGRGVPVWVAPALRLTRVVQDQAGLSSEGRLANLADAVSVRTGLVGAVRTGTIVVVDDVITTGATLVECVRALQSVGVQVPFVATVAATQRRRDRSDFGRSREPGYPLVAGGD